MRTYLWFGQLSLACACACLALTQPATAAEKLDRGVVAFQQAGGKTYIGWRLLAQDPSDADFDVFRSANPQGPWTKLNDKPLRSSCNFVDSSPNNAPAWYAVELADTNQSRTRKAVKARGVAEALDPDGTVAKVEFFGEGTRRGKTTDTKADMAYVSLKLQGKYSAQKVGLADFDGDGALDYLVKQPNFNTDPYQQPGYWKKSEDTYKLEAYRHDGTFMWRYDMGWAIEEGIWYSPIVVYDLDGDGRAEVFCKGGEGDPREPAGHVRKGEEFLVVLDGMTGKVRQRLPWLSREGFDDYNYYSRNLLGVAYLDGKNPHLVVERGTYKIIKVQTYTPTLAPLWYWEASGPHQSYRGQGMHGMHAADVDEDGRDELVLGSAVLDDNGKPLWNTRRGHPDICYVADVDPSRPGLEIFYGIEPGRQSNTVSLVEARTGKLIWGNPEITVHVHGQGMVGDIIPEKPGMESYAGEAKGGSNYWLYSANGERLGNTSLGELSPKAIYWLDGSTKVYIVNDTILRWPKLEIGRIQGRIVAIADCIGDWREEIITSLNGEVRVYSTTVPATTRRVCLMQDRLYRTDVAMQTMGYFYPPQIGGTPLVRQER